MLDLLAETDRSVNVIAGHFKMSRPAVSQHLRVLKEAGLTASTSEALRLIRQGGVRIDGEKVEDPALEIAPGPARVFQVGKRKFARVRVR